MMPLTIAPINKEFTVEKIYADGKLKSHLDSLGVLVGTIITPLIDLKGDLIVKVKDSRLALNKEVASKIIGR